MLIGALLEHLRQWVAYDQSGRIENGKISQILSGDESGGLARFRTDEGGLSQK